MFVGFDYGTSNCAMSFIDNGAADTAVTAHFDVVEKNAVFQAGPGVDKAARAEQAAK